MDEIAKKHRALNIQTNLFNLWHCLAIFLFIFFYYYFFTEKVPWFWYDDVDWLERAEKTPLLVLFKKIFDFVSGGFAYDRPVIEIYMKFCGLFFGDDPHYYRIGKIIIFSATICLMFYLTVRHGGNRFITLSCLCIFATFPSVIIVNTWINESAAFELFFKISSFVIFFILISISEEKKKLSTQSIMLGLGSLLVLLLIFGDKSKATAKIIPFIFLTYLLLIRHKGIFLYTIILISILAVFPYAAAGSSVHQDFYVNLFKTFLSQTWQLFVFVCLIGVLVKDKRYLRNRYLLFSFLWLIYEILFYVAYPSNEMRYLFSSLAAAAVFLSILFSNILLALTNESFKKIAKAGFVLVVSFILASNVYWSYNFRGSFAGYFVLVDKKMKFINQNFKDSLCIYASPTLLYYARGTSNLYVNVNPNSSGGKWYDNIHSIKPHEIYSIGPQGLRILNPEKYERIIALDESLLGRTGIRPIMVFDSIVPNSLYDLFQKKMNFKIYPVNFYNISLRGYADYPQYGAIYLLK